MIPTIASCLTRKTTTASSLLLKTSVSKTCIQNSFAFRTMASASQIALPPNLTGFYKAKDPAEDSHKSLSELLQKNHEKNHMYFNDQGFHNHIVHHLLCIYALGANAADLEKGYKANEHYQRPLNGGSGTLPAERVDKSTFSKYLGNQRLYPDYLRFFTNELASKDVPSMVKEYFLTGDEPADDMLVRLFSGLYHCIIHLGYGIEFSQPALVAEALAETATHNNWMGTLFYQAEAAAKKQGGGGGKSLPELAAEARATDKLRYSVQSEDANKIRDGILQRAPNELIGLASQWTCGPDELEVKTAEMLNFCAYMTLAAQNPSKVVKMDFFLMHAINSCPLVLAVLQQDYITAEQKCRILEWKARLDLAVYVSRGSPELRHDEVSGYAPRVADKSSWDALFKRVTEFKDDGHASKFIRALSLGENLCAKYAGEKWCTIKNEDWLKGANMVMDSVEGTYVRELEEPTWVRNAGFDEAWENVPEREKESNGHGNANRDPRWKF